MTLCKAIIYIFTFRVFESTRVEIDILRPFLPSAIIRKNSSSRFEAYLILKHYRTAA